MKQRIPSIDDFILESKNDGLYDFKTMYNFLKEVTQYMNKNGQVYLPISLSSSSAYKVEDLQWPAINFEKHHKDHIKSYNETPEYYVWNISGLEHLKQIGAQKYDIN